MWLTPSLSSPARLLALLVLISGCDDAGPTAEPTPDAELAEPDASAPDMAPPDAAGPVPGPVPETAQRPGDPEAGYDALINGPYITCGVPYSIYEQYFGVPDAAFLLPGRTGINARLPYSQTAITTEAGVDLVAPNCLQCHAGRINGELVIGLGNHQSDFTRNLAPFARAAGNLIEDEAEYAEWDRWNTRFQAVAPYTVLSTVGVNPADMFTEPLFNHRDPETMAWLDEPRRPLESVVEVPLDVPPLWRMARKNSLFYTASGRGDHARAMMTAATLCTDSLKEARAIDEMFVDVAAWLRTIEPPVWPWDIDEAQAEAGEAVFEAHCAECHGTYGEGPVYPNLAIDLEEVDTDPLLAQSVTGATHLLDWFNSSFYGELAALEPVMGYAAPPLDGIWATAPYLHNGSVPTLEALLNSTLRPTFWTRSFDSRDYSESAVGWRHQWLDHGKADEANRDARALLYDTTLPGYSNQGHLYGDDLEAEDRAALIEYLKTL